MVVSQFWAPGTLFFTALVPVVVAITSEVLKRPAEKITAVAPKVAPLVVPRRTADGTEIRQPAVEPVAEAPPEPEAAPAGERDDPFGLREPERRSLFDDRRVRLGLLTGLVAFVLAATFITASELTFGGSVGGGDRRTTLLGGSNSQSAQERRREREREREERQRDGQATPGTTQDPDDPEATPTATPSVTPSATPSASATPGASPSATPAPAAPPAATPQATPAP